MTASMPEQVRGDGPRIRLFSADHSAPARALGPQGGRAVTSMSLFPVPLPRVVPIGDFHSCSRRKLTRRVALCRESVVFEMLFVL